MFRSLHANPIRRLVLCGILAFCYAIPYSQAAVALRAIVPTGSINAAAEFPCADHDCGCRDAEQCRAQCCCVKPPPLPQPTEDACCADDATVSDTPEPRAVSFLSALACQGLPDVPAGAVDSLLRYHIAGDALVLPGAGLASSTWGMRPSPRLCDFLPDVPPGIPRR